MDPAQALLLMKDINNAINNKDVQFIIKLSPKFRLIYHSWAQWAETSPYWRANLLANTLSGTFSNLRDNYIAHLWSFRYAWPSSPECVAFLQDL